jgi:hypothetical protein
MMLKTLQKIGKSLLNLFKKKDKIITDPSGMWYVNGPKHRLEPPASCHEKDTSSGEWILFMEPNQLLGKPATFIGDK